MRISSSVRAGVSSAIFGITWVMNVSGTSHTPLRMTTGPSRTTGAPSTRMRDQFRVKVTTWTPARSRAWLLSGVVSSLVLSVSATRLSST